MTKTSKPAIVETEEWTPNIPPWAYPENSEDWKDTDAFESSEDWNDMDDFRRFASWMELHHPKFFSREDIENHYRAGGRLGIGAPPPGCVHPYDVWLEDDKDIGKQFVVVIIYPSADPIAKLFETRRAAVNWMFTQCLDYDDNVDRMLIPKKIKMINDYFDPKGVLTELIEVSK